jgi:hypothetical protein
VYLKQLSSQFIIIRLYIDDFVLVSNDLLHLTNFKNLLTQEFAMINNVSLMFQLMLSIPWFFLISYNLSFKRKFKTCHGSLIIYFHLKET